MSKQYKNIFIYTNKKLNQLLLTSSIISKKLVGAARCPAASDVFLCLLLKHLNQFLVFSRFHERRREESTAYRGAPNVRELYKYTHNIRKRHHAIK